MFLCGFRIPSPYTICAGYVLCGMDSDTKAGFLRLQDLFHSASEKVHQFVPVHTSPTPAPLMEPNSEQESGKRD